MSHSFSFGFQVVDVVLTDASDVGDAFYNFNTVALKPSDLLRIVGQQPNPVEVHLLEHLSSNFVFPAIGRKPEC